MERFVDSCFMCSRLQWRADSFCRRCKSDILETPLISRDAGDLPVYSLLHYVPPASSLVKLCKQAEFKSLTVRLAQTLALKFSLECLSPIHGVIPVPAREFGVRDHAYVVAEAIAEILRVPVAGQFLQRAAGDRPQKEKDVIERNLVKILAKPGVSLEDVTGCQGGLWILADDVTTTGATLSHAWKALGRVPAVGLTLASRPKLDLDWAISPARWFGK